MRASHAHAAGGAVAVSASVALQTVLTLLLSRAVCLMVLQAESVVLAQGSRDHNSIQEAAPWCECLMTNAPFI
jgi:hypothetical protein